MGAARFQKQGEGVCLEEEAHVTSLHFIGQSNLGGQPRFKGRKINLTA